MINQGPLGVFTYGVVMIMSHVIKYVRGYSNPVNWLLTRNLPSALPTILCNTIYWTLFCKLYLHSTHISPSIAMNNTRPLDITILPDNGGMGIVHANWSCNVGNANASTVPRRITSSETPFSRLKMHVTFRGLAFRSNHRFTITFFGFFAAFLVFLEWCDMGVVGWDALLHVCASARLYRAKQHPSDVPIIRVESFRQRRPEKHHQKSLFSDNDIKIQRHSSRRREDHYIYFIYSLQT